jgi:hypothetical protein
LCQRYRDEFGITLEMVDEPKFDIRVRTRDEHPNPVIVLPIAALEYLWAFSHYSWVLNQEYATAQKSGKADFDCVGNDRLQRSFRLLTWSKSNLVGSGREPWPEECPRPPGNAEHCSDEHVATELFLCALGWMLHHELGHVVLKHPLITTSFSEQEERAADKHATDWLLCGLHEDDLRLKKRSISISAAILCLQSLEVDSVSCLRNTHPDAHQRLFACTSSYKVGQEEIVEAFCTIILQYLFHEKGIKVNVNGKNFSEIFGDLLFEISRVKSS